MPGIDHRFCVRHLHANFKGKGFKGKEFKDALWGAARAPNEI
jgi:predicted SprT family Zn-dependent metalloprotease